MKKYALCLIVSFVMFVCYAEAFAGEKINEHLPDWIAVDLEIRDRVEVKDNFDFNDTVDDEDTYVLHRIRMNLAVTPVETVKAFLQIQDARVWDQEIGPKAGNENYTDIRQGYIELSDLLSLIDAVDVLPETMIGVRLGRQELSYGAQRLIGGFNWSNTAQTFEAGKLMLDIKDWKLQIDGFGGTRTPNKSPREADDWYQDDTKDKIAGYYATYKGMEGVTVEQYFISRASNAGLNYGPAGVNHADVYTMGGRVKGAIAGTNFDYELEAAKQWGQFGTLDVDAQMLVAILGYTLADMAWTPRFAFEFDYGSGDHDSSDSEVNTFNNLWPTNHIHYGYMDRASLQNLNNYRFQITAKPNKKTRLQADVHLINLDTSNDSLYHAGRGVLRTASGPAGEFVGTELDLTAQYKVNDHLALMGGYSHFFAGDYLEDTGIADDGNFFYMQSSIQF